MRRRNTQGCRPLSDVVWTVTSTNAETNRILTVSSTKVGGGSPLPPVQALQMELQGIIKDEAALCVKEEAQAIGPCLLACRALVLKTLV